MKQASIPQRKRRGVFGGENSTVLYMLIGFFIAVIAIQLISSAAAGAVVYPSFIGPVNLLNIMMQVSVVGICAMGMTLVMVGGGIDLSVGMLMSFVGLFTALGTTKWGIGLPGSIVLVIILAVALESVMGLIISRLAVEPFIITLGAMITYRGIALLICNSQEISIQGALEGLKTNLMGGVKDASGLLLQIPIYVLIFLAITVFMWWLLKYTKFGRRVYAVGANKNAAYLAGIPVKTIVLLTYTINGLLTAFAGIVLLSRVNTAIITNGQNLEIDVIAATVVGGVAMSGGKGNIWGTFIGAVLLGSIANGMDIMRLQSEWQFVAKGIIIIAAVSAGAYVATSQAKGAHNRQLKEAAKEGK
jgi:ribose/xylose/arabinose/galactoside ABC-type transport system permease subunit